MNTAFSTKPSKQSLGIITVFKDTGYAGALGSLLNSLKKKKEFEGGAGEMFYVFDAADIAGTESAILLGMGEAKSLTAESVMGSFGSAIKSAKGHKATSISVIFEKVLEKWAENIADALVLGAYDPSKPYKSGEAAKKLADQTITLLTFAGSIPSETKKSIEARVTLSTLTNHLRDWVNAPPNFAHMEFFEKTAKDISKKTGAKLSILKKKDLSKLNMGALLGVNRGSRDEARLVILEYTPKGLDSEAKKAAPYVFVGKGILFDSGGYNLKPSGHIEDMQLDKAGAATVLALVQALPSLTLKRRVIAIAPFTENLIGPDAQKPSEIVTTHSGKTVEITNTDAEGRLILADALSYAVEKYEPEFIVDLATLTGACVVALGQRYAGLFSNDEKLEKSLRAAGEKTDELLWPLPIHKDFADKMKGHYADLRNSDTGSSRDAGASKGAAFLKEFIGKTKWAHLDIAGPAFVTDPKKYEAKGATGFGLRLLVEFLQNL